ncbi:MAG: tetratricopeptide repeat protein [Gemmatimonadales bacterium]
MSLATRLLEEIRRRRVLQIIVVYAGAAWVLTEASQFVVENYGYSRRLLDAVVYLLVVGFPAAVVIAWYHGERGPQRPTRTETALLSVLAVIGLAGAYQIGSSPPRAVIPVDGVAVDLGDASVAVIPFDSQIADPEMVWLGQGLAELLTTGLAQLDALRVVSGQRLYDLLRQEGREEAEAIPHDLAMRLSRRAGARYMVRGTVLGHRDDITLNASLIDLQNGEVVAAARARGDDAFAVVDQVSAELSGEILASVRRAQGRPGELLAAELAPVAEITTRDIEAYRAYQQGLDAERRFRMEEARAHYERAIQLDSTFALAHLRLAHREADAGNQATALRELQLARRNLVAASERDRLLVDALVALRAQEDRETARSKLRELVDKYPDDKEGRFWLWLLSEGEERRQLIEEAIRLDPYYATAYNYLAYYLADRGEFEAADSVIARYVELEPDEPNPLDSRGEIYERAGDNAKARDSYRKALEIEPTFVFSLDHLARVYLREGRPAEARSELQAYLPAADAAVEARLRLLIGDTYAFEGRFDEALGSYVQAADIGVARQRPELRITGLTSAAWLELFTGNYDAAEGTASVLYGIDPFNNTALQVAMQAAGERGDTAALEQLVGNVLRAIEEAEAIRELDAARFTPDVLQAVVSYYRGEPGELVRGFDRLREEVGMPPEVFIMWEEVQAHREMGGAERALSLTKNLMSRIDREGRYEPLPHLRVLYEQGRAHELLGQTAEAAAAYQELVDQLGDALAEVPRLADASERLAELQGS